MEAPAVAMRQLRSTLGAAVLSGEMTPLDFLGKYCVCADAFLAELFQAALSQARSSGAGIVLLAVGGYGRSELFPGSDLDVVLVHDRSPSAGELAARIFYPVWDSGVRVDHSVRTLKEVLAVARSDLRSRASMFDARVVAGDSALGDRVLQATTELWWSHRERFLLDLADAGRQRQGVYGELPFLLEPDLKESAGGLRDIEAMRLAARALARHLDMAAAICPDHLGAAHRLLMESRVALHARTGNSSDRLVLQEQDEIASILGYEDRESYALALSAAGREVMWASEDGWRRIVSALSGPGSRTRPGAAPLSPGIEWADGEIALSRETGEVVDPALVLRMACAAARYRVSLSRSSLERLAHVRMELRSPWTVELREVFISLLEYGAEATRVIETLDRLGLFALLLPEWTAVRHLPQANAYHRFTVDRHLLETVAQAAALLRQVSRPDLLLLSALLHDIGKAAEGDHSEAGRELAGAVMARMGYSRSDTAIVERLVKRHLLLADTATRKDLDDPHTVELVAEAVGDLVTLELLAALTEADSIATGPAASTSWKAALVSELVRKVRRHLQGHPADRPSEPQMTPTVLALARRGRLGIEVDNTAVTVVAPDRPGLFAIVAGVLALARLDIRRAVAHSIAIDHGPPPIAAGGQRRASLSVMAVERFEVERPSAAEIDQDRLVVALERALAGEARIDSRLRELENAYARYRRALSPHSPEVVVLVDVVGGSPTAVVEIRAPDSHGLLYRLASVLTSNGLDVVSARIATLGHEVVDSFSVRELTTRTQPSAERLHRLRQLLVDACASG